MVDRYEPRIVPEFQSDNYEAEMYAHKDGDFVTYDVYEELADKHKKLCAMVREIYWEM